MARLGRPYPRTQPLGQLMAFYGLMVKDVQYATDINYRILSDYLAGRRPIRPVHLVKLAAALEVEPGMLTGEIPLPVVVTGAPSGVVKDRAEIVT